MLLLLLACSSPDPTGPVAWAIDYATVTPDRDGLSGHHVWVFYAEGWERDRDEGYHKCSLVQELEGVQVDAYAGCQDCVAMYELDLVDIEHDCPTELVNDPAFTGIAAFGVGAVTDEVSDGQPYPEAQGWYLSYDGEEALIQGYAFAEDLEFGRPEAVDTWTEGEVFTLWPAYAWEL